MISLPNLDLASLMKATASGLHLFVNVAQNLVQTEIVVKVTKIGVDLYALYDPNGLYIAPLTQGIKTIKPVLGCVKGLKVIDWAVNGQKKPSYKVVALNISGLALLFFNSLDIIRILSLSHLKKIDGFFAKVPFTGCLRYAGLGSLASISCLFFAVLLEKDNHEKIKSSQARLDQKVLDHQLDPVKQSKWSIKKTISEKQLQGSKLLMAQKTIAIAAIVFAALGACIGLAPVILVVGSCVFGVVDISFTLTEFLKNRSIKKLQKTLISPT